MNAEIETYEQALAFLGADHNTDDDFILTLSQVKVNNNSDNASFAEAAVRIIAETRDSQLLKHGHSNGTTSSKMTPQHAYSLLNIDEPSKIDDEAIAAAHQVAIADAPGRETQLNEALSIIAEERDSQQLRYQLSSRVGPAVYVGPAGNSMSGRAPPSVEEPRGLNNIGNTCYLNSLLQYLYTVKPVRDMVEQFDAYKQDVPEEGAVFEKKVADMKVDREGIIRTQACKMEAVLIQLTFTNNSICSRSRTGQVIPHIEDVSRYLCNARNRASPTDA